MRVRPCKFQLTKLKIRKAILGNNFIGWQLYSLNMCRNYKNNTRGRLTLLRMVSFFLFKTQLPLAVLFLQMYSVHVIWRCSVWKTGLRSVWAWIAVIYCLSVHSLLFSRKLKGFINLSAFCKKSDKINSTLRSFHLKGKNEIVITFINS